MCQLAPDTTSAIGWAVIRSIHLARIALVAYGVVAMSRCHAAELAQFDFENAVPRPNYSRLQLRNGGVIATITHPNIVFAVNRRVDVPEFNAAFGFQALSAFNGSGGALDPGAFVVDFNVPLSSASVVMGDFGEDMDDLRLEAYSEPGATGQLLARASLVLLGDGDEFSFQTLTVQAPSFRSLLMIGGSPAFPNSVFYDNISVTTVPEPNSLATFSLAVLCLAAYAAWQSRRRKGRMAA